MCGILGLFCYEDYDVQREAFDVFVDSLSHRGPNGRGVFHDKESRVWLGHRRLSILDLNTTGKQPMSYLNERYWITYNGEIYNFLNIKSELQQKGYVFKSQSDTEVILASYDCWKEKCLDKFNGMWGFAIWDKKKKEMFFARDRFGVKPFYYYFDNNILAFASEIKAFLSLSKCKIDFDNQIIADSINTQDYIETIEDTFFYKTKKLLPGHYGYFSKSEGLQVNRWWTTSEHLFEVNKSEEDTIDHFRSLLFDACKLRMTSDVNIGCSLSGGLDSSSVLCSLSYLMKNQKLELDKRQQNKLEIFSSIFSNSAQDESKYIEAVLSQEKIKANFCETKAEDLISKIDDIVFSMENITDVPIGPYLMYEEYKRRNIRISIDGNGGDEIIGGYHHHLEAIMRYNLFPKLNYKKYKNSQKDYEDAIQENPNNIPVNFQHQLKKIVKNQINKSRLLKGVIGILNNKLSLTNARNRILSLYKEKPNFYSYELMPQLLKEIKSLDFLTKELYLDFHFRTLPVILRNFDRMSMAHGIEVRSPFLDWRLVTYALSLNRKYKINNGYTKYILRESMKNLIPKSIYERKSKIGFASPLSEWIKSDLKMYVLDIVNSSEFLNSSIWDGKKIRDDIEFAYQTQNYNIVSSLWTFITTNLLIKRINKQKNVTSSMMN